MTGPSRHVAWSELSCWNRLGREWHGHAAGELIAPYPPEWREERAIALAATFERIRERAGHAPIVITSAYRTSDYNRAAVSTSSGARSTSAIAR